jgi:hypothetical protein
MDTHIRSSKPSSYKRDIYYQTLYFESVRLARTRTLVFGHVTPAVWHNEETFGMNLLFPSSRKKYSHMTMDKLISGTYFFIITKEGIIRERQE